MNKLTLVMPVYNTPISRLRQAVQSIEMQELPADVIIVDDGSKSEVADYLDTIHLTSHSLRVVHQPNGGVSRARNAGLELTNTEFFTFMDSDDELAEGFFEDAVSLIEQTGVDAVFGGMDFEIREGKNERYVLSFTNHEEDFYVLEDHQRDMMLESLFAKNAFSSISDTPMRFTCSYAAIFRSSKLKSVRFPEGIAISEDRIYNYRVCTAADTICLTSRIWYRHKSYGQSASKRLRPNAKEELTATANEFQTWLRHDDSQFDRIIYRGILNCFTQAIVFSVLRPGFSEALKQSKIEYIRELVDASVFQDAFANANPDSSSSRVLCFLGRHKLSAAIYLAYEIRKVKGDYQWAER